MRAGRCLPRRAGVAALRRGAPASPASLSPAGLLFFADLVLSFNVGYLAQHGGMRSVLVMDRAAVARLYMLRGAFLLDLLSVAAWFAQVALLLNYAATGGHPSAALDAALRTLRILPNLA